MHKDPLRSVWACAECEYESSNRDDMKNHIEAKHVLSAGLACDLCGMWTKTRKAMKMHKFRQHKSSNKGEMNIAW